MIGPLVFVLFGLLAFWLGRWSSREQIKTLRADLAMWQRLSEELHEENCQLRKAAL